jgi:glc operon protein GlcG
LDGVRSGSPDLAIGKARTSALLQRPSAETEANVDNGRQAFATAGLMTLRGGVPLMAGEQVVGAVGVASLNKDNDVTIAQAAAAAFASLSATHPPTRALVARRSEFVSTDAAGSVGVFPLDRPCVG